VLSPGESLTLCRAAAGLVQTRLTSMARRIEREDSDLGQLFMELAADLQRDFVDVHHPDEPGGRPGSPGEEPGQRAAMGFLPSLSKVREGVRLDRESGFYLVECLLEDLARLYGAIVRQSRNEALRELLLRWKRAIETRLEFLHRVVL
jgi:hypothetical protein